MCNHLFGSVVRSNISVQRADEEQSTIHEVRPILVWKFILVFIFISFLWNHFYFYIILYRCSNFYFSFYLVSC